MKRRFLHGVVSGLVAVACVDCHRSAGRSGQVADASAAGGSEASRRVFPLTVHNTKIVFVLAKANGKHEGSFGSFRGQVELTSGVLEEASIFVEFDTRSVTTDMSDLTDELRKGKTWDALAFPKASFRSSAVHLEPSGGVLVRVSGDLELHGRKQRIEFPAEVRLEGDQLSADAEFRLSRRDFGLTGESKEDSQFDDFVTVRLSVKATSERAVRR